MTPEDPHADAGLSDERAAEPEIRGFTTSDGVRLAYRDEGAGPALLCLPGLTRNGEDFDPVAERFKGRARVIRLDFRGRGGSENTPDYRDYTILREARDSLELMDALGLDRFAVLGTSRGGLVALVMAGIAAERMTGVILNDIGPAVDPRGLARIMGYLGVTPPHADLDAAAAALADAEAERFPGVGLEVWRRHGARVWRELPDGGLGLRYDPAIRTAFAEQAAGGVIVDLWPLPDRLGAKPLLLLRGENSDVLAPETAAEMRARWPHLRYVEVADRGHVPFLDEPEATAAIGAFIEELGIDDLDEEIGA